MWGLEASIPKRPQTEHAAGFESCPAREFPPAVRALSGPWKALVQGDTAVTSSPLGSEQGLSTAQELGSGGASCGPSPKTQSSAACTWSQSKGRDVSHRGQQTK